MVSMMGDVNGNNIGGFILLDGDTFEVKGRWSEENTVFGYDFWYQPRLNIMVSTSFGSPNSFKNGFDPSAVSTSYGNKMYFWNWEERTLIKDVDLGAESLIPLEVRFKHQPDSTHGFTGAALSSTIIHIFKDGQGEWQIENVITVPALEVENWALPHMPGLITDILISMDDKFLYFSNWIHGDIRQYNIEDPHNPVLTGQLWIAGSIKKGGSVITPGKEQPDPLYVKGTEIRGGPQMLQLSLDGTRLYVTTSLFSPWDRQFYPDMVSRGSQLVRVIVNNETGGLRIDENFLVDFENEPWGPALAHEVRYPGGDCSSDIWI